MSSTLKSQPVEFRADPSVESMYNVPLSQLSEDVPVQEEAVEDLVASIMAVGQLHPIAIAQDGRIIDGFHRVAALKRLSYGTALAVVHECDEADFWNRRIAEALRHGEIRRERVITWMESLYRESEFFETWDSLPHALNMWSGWHQRGKLPPGLGPQKAAQSGSARDRVQEERRAAAEPLSELLVGFDAWLTQQASRWGLRPRTVQRYINAAYLTPKRATLARKLRRDVRHPRTRDQQNARTRPLYASMAIWINKKRWLLLAASPPQPFDVALRNFRTAIDDYFARGEETSDVPES